MSTWVLFFLLTDTLLVLLLFISMRKFISTQPTGQTWSLVPGEAPARPGAKTDTEEPRPSPQGWAVSLFRDTGPPGPQQPWARAVAPPPQGPYPVPRPVPHLTPSVDTKFCPSDGAVKELGTTGSPGAALQGQPPPQIWAQESAGRTGAQRHCWGPAGRPWAWAGTATWPLAASLGAPPSPSWLTGPTAAGCRANPSS